MSDATGHLAAGAVVDLYAWPSDKVLQALKPGQDVPRTLISSAKTSSSGAFSLTVSATTLSTVAVSGAYANLEVDSGTSFWFITRPVTDSTPAVVQLTGAADDSSPAICAVKYKGQLHRRWGTVAQEYDWGNAPGVTQSLTYGTGQSTSLSIGFSKSGKYGSYTAGGSETETSSSSQSFPDQRKPGFFRFRTEWRVAKYLQVCGGGKTDVGPFFKHIVRSNGWLGGDDIRKASRAPKAKFCITELAGSNFHTSNERATTVSAGLTVAEVDFGVNMQTGYDTSAELNLHFNKQRHLCGTGNLPAPQAGIVVVKR